ncbi:hypothetical protein G6F57_017687 [Rhizopus arrhizus]|nr:hypothetical protein G6F57_017687 [Rhizopus arrhizus]
MPSWLADNLLVIVTAVLALIAFAIAWLLRRAGARRGDDDEETYAYNEPALDTAALNRKLDTINLDLDEPPTDEPRRGWQTQPHRQTVQDTLESALASFCGVEGVVPTICAGRTDTGVHGAMQVAIWTRRWTAAWNPGYGA